MLVAELITTMLQTGTESRLTADCSPIARDCNTGVTIIQIRTGESRAAQPMIVCYQNDVEIGQGKIVSQVQKEK